MEINNDEVIKCKTRLLQANVSSNSSNIDTVTEFDLTEAKDSRKCRGIEKAFLYPD